VNPDEDVMSACLRIRHIAGAHGVGVAVPLDHKCLHRFSPSRFRTAHSNAKDGFPVSAA
jgi:hypothetical protein